MAAYYRIYYDLESGECVCAAWARGDIRIPERNEDFARIPALSGRTEADVGVWEKFEQDSELERLIQSKKATFDFSQSPPALNWAEYPLATDDDEISDEDALKIITGEANI